MKYREEISRTRQKIYQLNQERQTLESKLMRTEYLNPGALYWRYIECRKEKCRCKKDKKYRHGPYPYLTYVENGKVRVGYVGKEELSIVEQGASRYVTFWKNMARMREINKLILKYLEQIRDIRIEDEKKLRRKVIIESKKGSKRRSN